MFVVPSRWATVSQFQRCTAPWKELKNVPLYFSFTLTLEKNRFQIKRVKSVRRRWLRQKCFQHFTTSTKHTASLFTVISLSCARKSRQEKVLRASTACSAGRWRCQTSSVAFPMYCQRDPTFGDGNKCFPTWVWHSKYKPLERLVRCWLCKAMDYHSILCFIYFRLFILKNMLYLYYYSIFKNNFPNQKKY